MKTDVLLTDIHACIAQESQWVPLPPSWRRRSAIANQFEIEDQTQSVRRDIAVA